MFYPNLDAFDPQRYLDFEAEKNNNSPGENRENDHKNTKFENL